MNDAMVRRVTTPAGDPAWLVTGYENVKSLLGDPRLNLSHPDPARAARFSEASIFGQPASPASEHADHARWRGMLTTTLSPRRTAELRPRVQQLVDGLLDQTSRVAPPVDFHALVSVPLPVMVIFEVLGVPYADHEEVCRWSDDTGDMLDAARSQAGLTHLLAYLSDLLAQKRAAPARDVLSDLVSAQAKEPTSYSDHGLARLAAGLLFGGYQTIVGAIDRGVILLLTNPDQLELVKRDPGSVARLVEEILRADMPVPANGTPPVRVPRYASTDLEVAGVTIAAGDLVLLDFLGANHDPTVFAQPELFDVQRAPNPHLSFGHGLHYCVGAVLARIELEAIFSVLFRRFPTLRLSVPFADLRLRSQALLSHGGVSELPVTW